MLKTSSQIFCFSQIQSHQVLLVFFTQNMDQNKLPHNKSAKNNNSSYQNKNQQLISKIQHYSQHYSHLNTSEQGMPLKNKIEHYTPETHTNNTKQQNYTQNN